MRECLNPIDKHLKQGQPPIIRSIMYILANFQHIEIPVLVYLKKKKKKTSFSWGYFSFTNVDLLDLYDDTLLIPKQIYHFHYDEVLIKIPVSSLYHQIYLKLTLNVIQATRIIWEDLASVVFLHLYL